MLLWVLFAVGFAYVTICGVMFILQDRLVWFPGPPPVVDPSRAGLDFEDLTITTSDGVDLHAWYVAGGPPVVLVSHGNAGSIEDRIGLMAALTGMGYGVLVYDYRGFGLSGGQVSEEGTYLDAEAAFDALVARGVAPGEIVLYGESLGGAVAIELARRRPAGHLVVENTFTSVPDVGAETYPWLPIRWLSRVRYDSLAKIGEVTIPVMVIHSPEDELIPFAHGRALYEAAGVRKAFLKTRGVHAAGGFRDDPADREAVAAFLAQ